MVLVFQNLEFRLYSMAPVACRTTGDLRLRHIFRKDCAYLAVVRRVRRLGYGIDTEIVDCHDPDAKGRSIVRFGQL